MKRLQKVGKAINDSMVDGVIRLGFCSSNTDMDLNALRTEERIISLESFYEQCPRLPSLEYNGIKYITRPKNTIGTFTIEALNIPYFFRADPCTDAYFIYSANVERDENDDVYDAEIGDLILDTRDPAVRKFILQLTILTIESSYGRYNENDYLAFMIDSSDQQHKKIKRHAEIIHAQMTNRKEFTAPLFQSLNSESLDEFYSVLNAKLNHYMIEHEAQDYFSEEDKVNEAYTISIVESDLPMEKDVSAVWFIDLLKAQIAGSKHQADYVYEATFKDTVKHFLQSTQNPQIPWSVRDYSKKKKRRYDDAKGNQHTSDSKLNAQVSQVLEDVEHQKDLQLSKTGNSTLFLDSTHLIHTVEHWGLTTDKIKDILSQQSSAYIFDIAKHLICSYTSDPKIYTEKRLIIDRGYKGFTERLSDEYSTKFNEVYVKESLLWWDSVRIRHGNSNVPSQTIFTLDGRPSQDQLLINYGQAITNPASKRLVPILNHPEGRNKARVVWNKLGLALSSMLVDESLIYKSNGGAGIPFGNEQINALKTLVNVSERRNIIKALDAFEKAEAIERNDGFLKLGSKNKDQELIILEGASLTHRAIKNAQKRTKSKAGKSQKK